MLKLNPNKVVIVLTMEENKKQKKKNKPNICTMLQFDAVFSHALLYRKILLAILQLKHRSKV